MRLAEEGSKMKQKRVVLTTIILASICLTLGAANFISLVEAPVSTGTIKIIKNAVPDFNRKFWFEGDLKQKFVTAYSGYRFSLTDYPSKTNYKLFEDIPAGVYIVLEDEDRWWKLVDVVISGDVDGESVWTPGTSYVTIDLDPGETIVVTFVNKPKITPEWKITYLGYEILDDLNFKFTYHVQSTKKYAISYWGLYCCCLDDTVRVVDASEKYEVQDHWIKFDEGYKGDEGREVWFVLHVEYYTPCRIGDTTYYIKGAQIAMQGTITGPTCGPGNTPERSSGITGVIISMAAALGLIVATNKKFVAITVEK
jgi:hypothetical protein